MGIIKYNRIVNSVAMSKSPHQSGLSLTYLPVAGWPNMEKNVIKIEAINPRMDNITSYLSMEIPVENIDDVIQMLNELKIDINKNAIKT